MPLTRNDVVLATDRGKVGNSSLLNAHSRDVVNSAPASTACGQFSMFQASSSFDFLAEAFDWPGGAGLCIRHHRCSIRKAGSSTECLSTLCVAELGSVT
jgi:hypothetical protein